MLCLPDMLTNGAVFLASVFVFILVCAISIMSGDKIFFFWGGLFLLAMGVIELVTTFTGEVRKSKRLKFYIFGVVEVLAGIGFLLAGSSE